MSSRSFQNARAFARTSSFTVSASMTARASAVATAHRRSNSSSAAGLLAGQIHPAQDSDIFEHLRLILPEGRGQLGEVVIALDVEAQLHERRDCYPRPPTQRHVAINAR